MQKFEMKFYWDDQEEAHYRKKETHKQFGMLKTWKLNYESEEEYEKRTEELIRRRLKFLSEIMRYTPAQFTEVYSFKYSN
jgi:hypothetical protein